MSNKSSKKPHDFLQTDNRDLRAVFAKIKAIAELNTQMQPLLDANLRNYCQVANLIGDRLILVAANGSIATQLRFQTAELLTKFKQHPILHTIHAIHCKVRPANLPQSSHTRPIAMQPLSTSTADIVRDIAKNLSDPKLRAIMERIATRTKG